MEQQKEQPGRVSLQLIKPEGEDCVQSGEAYNALSVESSESTTLLTHMVTTTDIKKGLLPETLSTRAKGLVFGNEEHIQLARQRRRANKKHGTTAASKKTRIQVEIREIPAIDSNLILPLPVNSLKEPKSKAALIAAPLKTLWDFVGEQTTEVDCLRRC